jgi:predicted esterase YcpF (UPF0227 family)
MLKNLISSLLFISSSNALGNNPAIVGVNLGGYFVLEPWITPSLFY